VIHDVDESLRELVRRDVLAGAGIEVSFEAPTREWAGRRSSPALDLYLYDIREDRSRRMVDVVEDRDAAGHVVSRRPPPRTFRLSYLVTAWTQRPEDEHRLLSACLGCFLRHEVLPDDVLTGSLADPPRGLRVTVALPPPQDRSISDVWTALGGELKPSLDLVVTVPFDVDRVAPAAGLVLEEPRFRFTSGSAAEEPVRHRPGADSGADPHEAAETAETVLGGRPGSGRQVTIRTYRRKSR